jgi:3-isopropylmalate/(R)-2-methylmalate dehydratase large subunit
MTDFFYRQIAKASLQEKVIPGQDINLKVDLALAHDGSGPEILKIFKKNGCKISSQCRVLITLDHSFPAPTIKDREFQREISEFARQYNIHLYKKGEGVLHQVVAEEESLWPGMIIVGADGHVATAGAFGGIAFSVSPVEFVSTLGSGSYKISVPDQVVIALEGKLDPTVMARDIGMHLMYRYAHQIRGKAVLLTGATIDQLTISEKMSICNFLPEAGVVTALVLPQGEDRNPDITIESEKITPMLSVPGKEPAFCSAAAFPKDDITVAIAGGCSAGRLDDMKVIADVLAKKEVHPDVTFIITPGSKNVMESMDKLKISSILRNGGAVIMPPGCGPCPGKHFGLLCDSDVAITTTIRNNPGRIGAKGAKIYLASPLTVACSAVNGKISEPA